MFESFARLAKLFIGQRYVVVRVGVGRSQLQGSLVGLNRFLHASGLVEHVAQIEVGERVARIGFEGLAIIRLSKREILAVVIKRAQINVRGRVNRLDFEDLVIGRDRVGLGRGISSEGDAAGEPCAATSFSCGLGTCRGTGVVVSTFSRSEKSIRN